MAKDTPLQLMHSLGFPRFKVLARTTVAHGSPHRMLLDHAASVGSETHALLDIAPTLAMYEQAYNGSPKRIGTGFPDSAQSLFRKH
jgi:hypothetical protein